MDYLIEVEKEYVEILKKYSKPMYERLTKMDQPFDIKYLTHCRRGKHRGK